MAGRRIQRIGIVGTGLIGASWAALFLARGFKVNATDPSPGAQGRLHEAVRRAWPVLEILGLAPGASPDNLRFWTDLEHTVAEADFVQESGPEREDTKRELFRRLDAATAPDVVLASSSSALKPSLIQAACRHPERVLVGHPFNPPHLVPLVEVVGGERTGEPAIDQAMAVYRAVGKHPIRIRRELNGHVANRLQAAIWREAFYLVEIGAVTVGEIDAAIAHGPGLRWALMGPCLIQHLAGGAGGMAHALAHFGPFLESVWAELGSPSITPELARRLGDGVADELAGRDLDSVLAERDRLLVELIRAKAAAPELP